MEKMPVRIKCQPNIAVTHDRLNGFGMNACLCEPGPARVTDCMEVDLTISTVVLGDSGRFQIEANKVHNFIVAGQGGEELAGSAIGKFGEAAGELDREVLTRELLVLSQAAGNQHERRARGKVQSINGK